MRETCNKLERDNIGNKATVERHTWLIIQFPRSKIYPSVP